MNSTKTFFHACALLLTAATLVAPGAVAQQQPAFPPPGSQPPAGHPPPVQVASAAVPLVAALANQLPVAPDIQSRVVRIRSPYRSRAKTRQMEEQIATDVTLQLGYAEVAEADPRVAKISGALDRRHFIKSVGDETRKIDVFLMARADGGYDAVAHGLSVSPRGETENPDLQLLTSRMTETARAQTSAQPLGGAAKLEHFMVQLSYIQSDQAMAMLKALGYSTVEFNKQTGDSAFESLYDPILKGQAKLPTVIKFIDAPKTSLMDPFTAPSATPGMPPPQQFGQGQARTTIPDIGGTYLHHMTSGEPQQRLLVLYDPNAPEDLETLLNVLRETIDVPARQVVISALVVEVNTDRARELGFNFTAGNGQNTFSFKPDSSGNQGPFTFTFNRTAPITPTQFSVTLSALIRSGDAEILSSPSVLVLDGRQARIQVGKQVPVVNSTATVGVVSSSVEYFPVGIVLNLRPRINEDNTEVTMQVETIVSAIGQNAVSGSSAVVFAPTIDNRQVQTFVRVADNTPFIIGGLISSDRQNDRSGIPLLSQIPYIGSLFRRTSVSRTKREVIVVLTPHIVPLDDPSFSYVIPKDSDTFDTFGYQLFRNAYRVRNRDVFDLRFVYESEIFKQLVVAVRARAEAEPALRQTEPYKSLIEGQAPGEEILVHRMMWEIIRKLKAADAIEANRMIFFQPSPQDAESTDFVLSFLDRELARLDAGNNALILTFDAASHGTPEHPFVQPKALVSFANVTKATYEKELIARNTRNPDGTPKQWSIILSDEHSGAVKPLDVLRAVVVLKRLLALNSTLPLSIKEFHVGRQIIFPTEQDITQTFHVIDRDAARLFYEVMEYYRAFEQEFNAETRAIARQLRER